MSAPWTFEQAVATCQRASRMQGDAEEALKAASVRAAEAEQTYRVAFAKAIVTLHDEGAAWTVAPDLARGDVLVARLRYERDVAEGMRDATTQLAWRRSADRKDAQRFADWSARRELAEHGQPDPRLSWTERNAA